MKNDIHIYLIHLNKIIIISLLLSLISMAVVFPPIFSRASSRESHVQWSPLLSHDSKHSVKHLPTSPL